MAGLFHVLSFYFITFHFCKMEIQEWFNKGCGYDVGVSLYQKHGKNALLLRRFMVGENAYNREKLKHELLKLVQTPSAEVKPKPEIPSDEPTPAELPKVESPDLKKFKSKPISDYPPALHSVYQLRVFSFYEAASLKVRLNELPEDKEDEALKLQLEIWDAIKENEKCWSILDYFDETGEILPTESTNDYSKLKPQELVNQRQRLYANRSKRLKTIKNKEAELATETNPARKLRMEKFLTRKIEELQAIQNDIDALTELIQSHE